MLMQRRSCISLLPLVPLVMIMVGIVVRTMNIPLVTMTMLIITSMASVISLVIMVTIAKATMISMVLTTTMAKATMISMVLTMVMITAMARATWVGTMVIPLVAMTLVMSLMVSTMPMVMIMSLWGITRLNIWLFSAFLWWFSAHIRADSTQGFAVGVFDGTLNMTFSNDGIWKGNVVSETTTPVINEKVILDSIQSLPNIRLLIILFVEGDVL